MKSWPIIIDGHLLDGRQMYKPIRDLFVGLRKLFRPKGEANM